MLSGARAGRAVPVGSPLPRRPSFAKQPGLPFKHSQAGPVARGLDQSKARSMSIASWTADAFGWNLDGAAEGKSIDGEIESELDGWHDVSQTAELPPTVRAVKPPRVPALFSFEAGAEEGAVRVCSACAPILRSIPSLKPQSIRTAGTRLHLLDMHGLDGVAMHQAQRLSTNAHAALRASCSGSPKLAMEAARDVHFLRGRAQEASHLSIGNNEDLDAD